MKTCISVIMNRIKKFPNPILDTHFYAMPVAFITCISLIATLFFEAQKVFWMSTLSLLICIVGAFYMAMAFLADI